ncbi:hypothetical protein K8I31_11135 [bacterium]|nr:hypothetical protein [bacterium]
MSVDPLRTYEFELIEQMEAILDAYHFTLLDKGVSARQAEQKLANAEMFLIQYHAYHYLDDLSCLIPERISDFLHCWYFERVDCRSESDWRETSLAVQELLQYLFDTETLDFSNPLIYIQAAAPKANYQLLEDEYQQRPLITAPQDDVPLEELLEDDFDDAVEEFQNLLAGSIFRFNSIEEILEQLNQNLPHLEQHTNVIALVPRQNQEPQDYSNSISETIDENVFNLLRGNRVFQRWLERNRRHLSDIRSSLRERFDYYDSLLLKMNQMAKKRPESCDVTPEERMILERLDKQLWSLRNRISAELRLDLRCLCF